MAFNRYQIAKEKLEQAQKSNSSGILMTFTVNTMEDERVCPDCAKFEGYTENVSKAIIGENHPPFHNDCRCFATYQIDSIKNKK